MYCKYNPTCHSNLHLRCNAIEVHRNALQIRSSSYSSVECIFHFQMKQIIEMQLISQIHACDAVQLKCIAMHCKSIPTHQSNIYPRYNDQCIVYFQLMLSIEIQVISKSLFFQYNAIEGHHNRNITTHSVWIWVTSLINPHLWCNATHWDLMHCVRFTCYVLLFWPMKRLFFINWPITTEFDKARSSSNIFFKSIISTPASALLLNLCQLGCNDAKLIYLLTNEKTPFSSIDQQQKSLITHGAAATFFF